MVKLVNRAKMAVSSGGAGILTLGAAPNGYQTFTASGVSTGDYIRYTIEDGSNWEVGLGYYNATGPTLTRNTIHESSNSGNAITCSSDAVIFVTMSAEDFTDNSAPDFVNTIPSTLELNAGAVSTINAKALDDDGFPVTYSFDAHNGTTVYSASSLPPQFSSVSINQTTGVFSLTATSQANGAGNVNFRVRASDGVRTATKTTACSLSFLPTNGLTGLYDMKDSNSYSGSGSTWADISGNSGPNLTIDTNVVTYNSSGIGGIPSISLDTNTATPAIKVGPAYPTGLTNTNSPYDNTVVMIYSRPSSLYQTYGFWFPPSTSQGGAIVFESSSNAALRTGTAMSGSWNHQSATTTSKLYINKVDQTSMTQLSLRLFLLDSNNQDKYHSVVITNGHYLHGWATSNVHPNLTSAGLKGDIRALVFYNRALSSNELAGLHAHFAADYTSSEMTQ